MAEQVRKMITVHNLSDFTAPAYWFKIVPSENNCRPCREKQDIEVSESILRRIASGDGSAVQDCLDAYGGLVWSLARRMLPDRNDAEDAVQEIFIEIWRNAERFDETRSSETTFIAMIARRRLIDRLRKATRQPIMDSVEEMVIEPAGATSVDPQVAVEAGQAAELMNRLRPEQKLVLELAIMQGYSHSEISEALDMPLGTVKTHARRGLIEIKEILRSQDSTQGKEVSA